MCSKRLLAHFMELYLFSICLLVCLAACDLVVGVSNDAVNFLNSSIGSRVAPRKVIMIIAGLGMLVGVTFSSGMMEVARKGIFHPRFFVLSELITIFLAVMLTDVLLLDVFNTFGLPTSTTVSIVFELLGAAVAVSLIKLYTESQNLLLLVEYINTGKALAIIAGILLSVVIAFVCGALAQVVTRAIFTFDYEKRLRRYGGIWGGLALAVITYFILIKGAKGTSFLSSDAIAWIKTHGGTLFVVNFLFFGLIFQLTALFTRVNILKPIVLIGTFALAMAFAGNDLVNFIGVPLAGIAAYRVASASENPLSVTMEALQQPIRSNTAFLLIAGVLMVITLWVSKKARSVTRTEIGLGSQAEGTEQFGSSALSRNMVRFCYSTFDFLNRFVPRAIRAGLSRRLDPGSYRPAPTKTGKIPSFDLLRASVNLIVASAVVSFATSLKLPLSTTYVTFMVAMGTSLSDQAWGRESAVYRITGVLTVIGGWFLTAIVAFTISMIFACLIHYLKFFAILLLLVGLILIVLYTYRLHFRREEQSRVIRSFSLGTVTDAEKAIDTSFEQTGQFLKEVADNLDMCFEAATLEDRKRLADTRTRTDKIQQWANIIATNTFQTLASLHQKSNVGRTLAYGKTIRPIQGIAESHRDIIMRCYQHFENLHLGFSETQKEELNRLKTYVTRLLWNASIMLLRRKRVDFDYISSQVHRLATLVSECDKNQIDRIQRRECSTRISILYYALTQNCLDIAKETRNLLDIFNGSFKVDDNVGALSDPVASRRSGEVSKGSQHA